jgi:Putative translation initiation inhibitor, yjgF family
MEIFYRKVGGASRTQITRQPSATRGPLSTAEAGRATLPVPSVVIVKSARQDECRGQDTSSKEDGMSIEQRLKDLGIALPAAAAAVANYVPFVVTGNLVFVSGQLPLEGGKPAVLGKLGKDVGVEDGARAARLCALNLLAQVKAACGDLDRVRRVVRLTAFVASDPTFTEQPKVVNGASDLMVEVLGDAGRHARVAVGAPSLPLDVAVEIEGVFEIAP